MSNRPCPIDHVQPTMSNWSCPTDHVQLIMSNWPCPIEIIKYRFRNRDRWGDRDDGWGLRSLYVFLDIFEHLNFQTFLNAFPFFLSLFIIYVFPMKKDIQCYYIILFFQVLWDKLRDFEKGWIIQLRFVRMYDYKSWMNQGWIEECP
jgi:hypothetical protein